MIYLTNHTIISIVNILEYKKIDLMIQDYLDCENKIEDCEKTKDEKVLNVFLNRYMISKVK